MRSSGWPVSTPWEGDGLRPYRFFCRVQGERSAATLILTACAVLG